MAILNQKTNKLDTFTIARNTLSKSLVADARRKVDIEVGDAKQPDLFYPQFKTKHWDNECNFSVRLIDNDYRAATVKTANNKTEWERNGVKARFYEKNTLDEDGGFEFEVELAAKPAVNVLTFSIETKWLDFFYQPELTEEQKKAGAIRPENVVGSYAVYHKFRKNDIVGGKNYKTGKAFHIYRPFAEDANGARVWCELNIDELASQLTITIPQDFLDSALYPILVDPTFGYTSQGASEGAWGANDAIGTVVNALVSSSGIVDSVSFYQGTFNNTGAAAKGFITDSSLSILTNGITSSSGDISGTSVVTLRTLTFSTSPTISSGASYYPWIVIGNATSSITFDSAVGSSGDVKYETDNNFSSPTNPSSVTDLTNGDRYSIYATYTPSGTDTNSERAAEVHGSVTTNSERNSELTGTTAPVLTATQNGANIDLEWTYSET